MYNEKRIAVVIPAYNEQLLISRTLDSVPEFVDHVVVIDDCSQDETVSEIQRYTARCPERYHLIEHAVNQGVGGAIAGGYVWCRDHAVDVAVVMAGDNQMDPADMPALLDPVVAG
ncbi:MAG: glycosyltransferase family 2 protein, partial [Caldilineaceae bacterium]|nr:glycosyltransferase family 2 protein [Caldilineaceae bacterium]